jgi:hypothetical protein
MPWKARRNEAGAQCVLDEEEVLAKLGLGELVGARVEVLGQEAHGTEVGLLGALAEADQLQLGAHLLTQRRGADRGAHAGSFRGRWRMNHTAKDAASGT